tara:strand:+ start:192 stop:407 length:216 start_codon:yes stop_codon:yes gene_type:complete
MPTDLSSYRNGESPAIEKLKPMRRQDPKGQWTVHSRALDEIGLPSFEEATEGCVAIATLNVDLLVLLPAGR